MLSGRDPEESMIRVGLVGFGMAGRVFHAPLISSVEGLELAAVVERSGDKAAERYPGITTYRSVEELLADASIKFVVVATPNAATSRSPCKPSRRPKALWWTNLWLSVQEKSLNLPNLQAALACRCFPFITAVLMATS